MKSSPFAIPREIKIRGKRWLVLHDVELGDTKHEARSRIELASGINLGAMYPHGPLAREIHLSSVHKNERHLAETFLHELLHACSSQPIGLEKEEKLISDIERPLLKALEQLEWK